MSFSPEETAAGERLGLYNIRTFSPTNPYGLGQGGQRNYTSAADDLSVFGSAVVRETQALLALVQDLTDQAQLAALLVEGGPVSTVQVGDGPIQSGAVKIDLSALSAQVNTALQQVQAAQANLVAAQAGLLDDAISYNRAFGA